MGENGQSISSSEPRLIFLRVLCTSGVNYYKIIFLVFVIFKPPSSPMTSTQRLAILPLFRSSFIMGHPYFIGHIVSTRLQVTYCAPDDSLKDHERLAVILKPGFTGLMLFKTYIKQPLNTGFGYPNLEQIWGQTLIIIIKLDNSK